jgi:F0F1-type ATP synthase delta subunit
MVCAALAISICIFGWVVPAAKSQQAQSPGEEKAQKVAQVLNLTPQQRSQLAPILDAEAPKVKSIVDDPNLSPSEKKKRLKAVHSQSDPLVKSILNPTQYKQWETIRKDELEQMK